MVGLAEVADAETEQSDDPGDDPQVDAFPLEPWPLLDVQLEVTAYLLEPARVLQACELEAGLPHRLGNAARLPVAQLALPGEGPAAEHPGAEAGAFLVVE